MKSVLIFVLLLVFAAPALAQEGGSVYIPSGSAAAAEPVDTQEPQDVPDPAEQVALDLQKQGREEEAAALLSQNVQPQSMSCSSNTAPELERNPFVQYPDWITTGEIGGLSCDVYVNQCYVWYSSPPVMYCRVCCVHYYSNDGLPYGSSLYGQLNPLACTGYF